MESKFAIGNKKLFDSERDGGLGYGDRIGYMKPIYQAELSTKSLDEQTKNIKRAVQKKIQEKLGLPQSPEPGITA